jgi:hypothetical protein
MESISSLRKQLSEKNKEIDKLRQSTYRDPEVVKAKEVYDELLHKARLGIEEKIHKILEEQSVIDKKIDAIEAEKGLEIPQEVQVFFNKLYHGVNWGSAFKIRWVSPSKKYIIATMPGSMYWSGRMEHYGKAKHYLFDITKDGKTAHGIEVYTNCKVLEAEGRLSAETIKQWKEYVIKEEANG